MALQVGWGRFKKSVCDLGRKWHAAYFKKQRSWIGLRVGISRVVVKPDGHLVAQNSAVRKLRRQVSSNLLLNHHRTD